jgi:hypothetical protein
MDLTTFTKIIFKDRKNYIHLTDKDKKDMFFIFNRYMSRVAPMNSDAMNTKGVDGSLGIEVWNNHRLCVGAWGIPDWFFPRVKAPKSGVKGDDLDDMDMLILNNFFTEQVQEYKNQELADRKKKESIVVKEIKKKKASR